MELVFSQRADSNRDEPANAQDQSRDCTTAAGLAQSISDRLEIVAPGKFGVINRIRTGTNAFTGRDAAVTS